MTSDRPASRRRYSAEVKSQVMAECDDRDKRRFVACAILDDPVCAP